MKRILILLSMIMTIGLEMTAQNFFLLVKRVIQAQKHLH
jgi:hypothetical protein